MIKEAAAPHLMYKYKKILVVDDSDMQRFITEMILKRNLAGEHVVGFEGAQQALDHLCNITDEPASWPDLILLDIAMPDMDGFEFLDKFAGLPVPLRDHCKIIMLTSSLDETDRVRALKYPFVEKYLTKPFVTGMLEDL